MRLPKKKAVKAAVAGLAASAMLLTAMPAYAGIGSGGIGVHGGSNVGPSGDILYLPELKLCGDNGAMIGCQGYYEYLAGKRAGMDLNAFANRDIGRG